MKRKLDIVKAKEPQQEGVITTTVNFDQSETIKKMDELNKSLKSVWRVLNDKEEYDFDKLADQLRVLHTRLDFTPIILGLEKLHTSQEALVDKQTSIKDFSKLLEAVQKNKPVAIDLSKLEKAVIQVEQRIQESIVEQGQAPDDYQPVRRVIKVGNRLVWDDQPTPTRGGGGGASKPTIQYALIAQSGAGTDTLVGANTSYRIKVIGYVVVMGSAGTVTFKSGTTALTGAMSFAANGGASSAGTEHFPVFATQVGEALNITSTGAAAQGHLSYILE